MWSPSVRSGRDLLATTGDYLRLWDISDDNTGRNTDVSKSVVLLDNNKNSEYCAPLTSFDWNETDPNIIGTSSIDTTVTIWDIETQKVRTQLIAHDKEVYDIAFTRGKDIFASAGADGSIRMFDLRALEHSTIIFESSKLSTDATTNANTNTAGSSAANHGAAPDRLTPLLRVSWNKQDPNYLATVTMDSRKTVILDIRVPSLPVAELDGHTGVVNAVAWAPHSSCHICTAGEDTHALIWDLSAMPTPIEDPILAYDAKSEINNLLWSETQPDWISIAFDNKLQILRV